MFFPVVLFIFLKYIKCPYTEVEGIFEPTDNQPFSESEMLSGKYYWFEHENKIYLFHFQNNSRSNEDPFVLIVAISGATSKNWPEPENPQLLADAFDDFHKTSAYLSFLQNKDNRRVFVHLVTLFDNTIEIRVKLGLVTVLMSRHFKLNELSNYAVFLKHVNVDTTTWSKFYEERNDHYGLFTEAYYVTFPERVKNLGSVSLFRIGDVSKALLTLFQVNVVEGKTFLSEAAALRTLFLKEVTRNQQNDHYAFQTIDTHCICNILFDLKQNGPHQFRLSVKSNDLGEVPAFEVEKLFQVGYKTYYFTDGLFDMLKIVIPDFLLEQKIEVSKLMLSFRIYIKQQDKPLESLVLVKAFDFQMEENCFTLYIARNFQFCLKYTVQNEILNFSIPRVVNWEHLDSVSTSKNYEMKHDPTFKKKFFEGFLSGAIIFDANSIKISIEPKPKEEEERKADIRLSPEKMVEKPQKVKMVYIAIGLILVVILFSAFWFYFCLRKKIPKRRAFDERIRSRIIEPT